MYVLLLSSFIIVYVSLDSEIHVVAQEAEQNEI